MSLVLTSVGVAAGLAFGRWLARRAAIRSSPRVDASPVDVPIEVPAVDADEILWSRFPCRLGDVIVRPSGDEAWLAGAIILSEDVAAAVLFVAPEAKADVAVYVRAKPVTEIFWLTPVAPAAWSPPVGEPPATIEIDAEPFERVRRLPYRTERLGEATFEVAGEIVLAEYKSLRSLEKRVISISGAGNARAWIGAALDIAVCDVLPAGKRAGATELPA